MRLFVGVDLGQQLAASIDEDAASLRGTLHRSCPRLPARWVSRANLHLTLVFIGHVIESEATSLIAALQPALSVSSFDLAIGGFGTFPASGPLRVIWMGIASGAHEVSLLHDEVTARIVKTGRGVEDRAYSPHLTVARVKDARGPAARAAREAVTRAVSKGGMTRVEEATLFRSHQSAAGSVYERLLRIPLQK
jgi:2'-5' RNA ligase